MLGGELYEHFLLFVLFLHLLQVLSIEKRLLVAVGQMAAVQICLAFPKPYGLVY